MIWQLKSIIRNNKLVLKCFSCLVAYTLWAIVNQLFEVTITKTIPVVIYQTDSKKQYTCTHEYVSITLQAQRCALNLIDLGNLAVHIPDDKLSNKKNLVQITHDNLLLPPDIHMIQSNPSFINVELATA